jgi:hypothetical protein
MIVASAIPCLAQASDPPPAGWTEASRNKDLTIFYQESSRTNSRAYRAVGEADVTPEAAFKVVADVDSFTQFMPFTKESRVVKRLSPTELIAYQRIAAPMIAERDFDIDVKHQIGSPANKGVYKSEWSTHPNFEPEKPGIVRIPVAEGSWILEPLDGGKRTRITYTSLTAVGGSIPGWMTNMSNESLIPNIFESVRKRAVEILKAGEKAGQAPPAQK